MRAVLITNLFRMANVDFATLVSKLDAEITILLGRLRIAFCYVLYQNGILISCISQRGKEHTVSLYLNRVGISLRLSISIFLHFPKLWYSNFFLLFCQLVHTVA